MNDDTTSLHPWIEPELEARLAALVLGEASDFERDELERLVAERPELALHRKRLATLHRMLREVATGESAGDQGRWKLAPERREAVLARLSDRGGPRLNVVTVKRKTKAVSWIPWSPIPEIAAVLVVVGLALCLVLPVSNRITRFARSSEAIPAQIARSEFPANESLTKPTAAKEAGPGVFGTPSALAGEPTDGGDPSGWMNYSFAPAVPSDSAAANTPAPATSSAPDPARLSAVENRVESGDSDQAAPEYDNALNQDRYSIAARSGQEKNERYKLNYYDQTYEEARARMLRQVAEGRESPMPESIRTESAPPDPFANPAAPSRAASVETETAQSSSKRGTGNLAFEGDATGRGLRRSTSEFDGIEKPAERAEIARREDKLKSIVLPSVEFSGTTLRDALRFLEERSAELDTAEPDPAKRGIRISTDSITGTATESTADPSGLDFEESAGGDVLDTEISLRLANVPLAEALRYTTALAQTKTRVDSDKVEVLPLSAPSADLYTNVYTVPPSFFWSADSDVGSGSSNLGDPFASAPPEAGSRPAARMSARWILESAGITFPPGSSVVYNPETSQLVVRNTEDQMELVEAMIESIRMDSGVDASVEEILALTPQLGAPEQDEPRSLRDEAPPSPNTIDQLIAEAAGAFPEAPSEAPEIFGIAGVATEPGIVAMRRQLQSLRRPPPSSLDETSPETEPFSTFSLHVSNVSFQLAKAALASGKWPEAGQIRIDEFINAFDYGDPVPSMDERVAARIDQAAHPFLQQRQLVRIALRTAEAGRSAATPLRLTFLLDNSGSMERPDRRETTRRALATLTGLLGEHDRVTLVSFARQPRLVAEAVPGHEAARLAETAAALPSEGGTNMGLALDLAFEKAREHFDPAAQNRIVMLTDGAANLGDADPESLAARVAAMRGAGIAFDAAGIGADGLNDEILATLARQGDGRYFLLDRPEDAEEGFAKQIAGALRPAAKNVKVQVEFDPARVKSYKLLGFEKHRLATEDFRDDSVDAAELAAAEAGVAVYQVEPDPAGWGDLGSVSVRFRDLENDEMVERRWPLPYLATAPPPEQGSDAIRLATVASQFAAKLAGGPLGDLVDLGELARLAAGLPHSERVRELREMIDQARTLMGADVKGYR